MGRVFAWKLKRVKGSAQSDWTDGYAWLSSDGGGFSGGTQPDYMVFNAAKEYAKTLNDFESYNAAFNSMLSIVPREYLCTSRLRSPEEYFYDPCEWGGQSDYCGVDPPPRGSLTVKLISPSSTQTNICNGSYTTDSSAHNYPYSYTVLVEAENVIGNISFTDGNGTQVPGVSEVSCSGSVKKYKYTTPNTLGVGNYSFKASASNADSASVTYKITEGSATFTLSPSATTISGAATTATVTLTTSGIASATGATFPDGSWSRSGNVYTLTFPNHCEESSSGSTKPMTFTVFGVSGSTSGACSAIATITQEACEELCSPSVVFTDSGPINVSKTDTSYILSYTVDCADDVAVSCTNTSVFSVEKQSGNKVKVSFSENGTASSRSATITIKATKSGKPDATDTIDIVQAGQTDRSISITGGPYTVPLSGGTLTLSVASEFVALTGTTINPSSVISGAPVMTQGTTSISNASGTGDTTITVISYVNNSDVGSGDYTLSLTSSGYQSRNFKTSCSEGGSGEVCLTKTSRTFTVQVSGRTPEGTSITSNTVTVTQG